MKRIRKQIAAAAACLLALSGLAGCTSGEIASSGGASGPSGGAGTVKEALKFDASKDLDLQGKTLTISAWGGVVEEGQDEYYDRRYALERRTEERYHVNIEWMANNPNTFVQDVTLAYSSGKKYADLMFAPSYYGFDLAKLGAVVPLDDYIDYSKPCYAITGENLRYVDGKHYSYMPDEISVNSLGYFVIYNTTLLEKNGCPDPFELYQQGQWDWEHFGEIAKKCTIVSNGEVVQYGIGGSNLLDALCLSNGFSIIQMDTQQKKFTCGLNTAAGLNTLNFVKKLVYDYKSCDGWYGTHNSKFTFGDAKLAMLICPQYYPNTFVSEGMSIGSVPMPKGSDASGPVNGLELQEWWMASAISDFSTEELLLVALDMNENDPAYPDTYISDEAKKENFVVRSYDTCVFSTEEEAQFFYDYIVSNDVKTIMNITTDGIKAVIAEKVFTALQKGEDPRTVMERVQPVIDEALKDMLPQSQN